MEETLKTDVISQEWHKQQAKINRDMCHHRRRLRFFERCEQAMLLLLVCFHGMGVAYLLIYELEILFLTIFAFISTMTFSFGNILNYWLKRQIVVLDCLTELKLWMSIQDITDDTLRQLKIVREQMDANTQPHIKLFK